MKERIQKITPFLWFDSQAEEAVNFYTSIFKKSRIGRITRHSKAGEKVSGRPAGSVRVTLHRIRKAILACIRKRLAGEYQ